MELWKVQLLGHNIMNDTRLIRIMLYMFIAAGMTYIQKENPFFYNIGLTITVFNGGRLIEFVKNN